MARDLCLVCRMIDFSDQPRRCACVAKPARSEKETGLRHLPVRTAGEATDREEGSAGLDNPRAGAGRTGGARNTHETVKRLDLMRWLLSLVARP